MPKLQYQSIELDTEKHQVTVNQILKRFSPTEYILLKTLLENKNHVVSRVKLMDQLYGYKSNTNSNTLDVFLHKIRKKIGSAVIHTKWRVGVIIGDEHLSDKMCSA